MMILKLRKNTEVDERGVGGDIPVLHCFLEELNEYWKGRSMDSVGCVDWSSYDCLFFFGLSKHY